MSFVNFVERAVQMAKKSNEFEKNEDFENAYNCLLKSIEIFLIAIKHENRNLSKKKMLKDKTEQLMRKAESLKVLIKERKEAENPSSTSEGETLKNKKGTINKTKEDLKMEKKLQQCVVIEKPKIKLEDVGGLEAAKDILEETLVWPARYPHMYAGRENWKGILFYGPPGCGKTLLAKAIANTVNQTFFNVSAADLTSKWLGESEKLVRALYKLAREKSPSIIFIDEIDSLCSARSTDSGSNSNGLERLKTEFLVQMQGVSSQKESVVTIGATNIPQKLDQAIRRRFERRVYIPLPDEEARFKLFKINSKLEHTLTDQNFRDLAKQSDGYSGADVNVLCRNAFMEPIRQCRKSKYFKQVSGPNPNNPNEIINDLWIPADPMEKGAIKKDVNSIQYSKLICKKTSYRDFKEVLKTSKPSVSKNDLLVYNKFTDSFGMDGK